MHRRTDGYHVLEVDGAQVGDRYGYRFDGGEPQSDPASRFQPEGVHGLSEVVSSDQFAWTDEPWQGVAQGDLIIYESHIGALTTEGTYLAAIPRLDELVDLGVKAIELMPVADAAGRWNWGYDGVCLFAPNRSYGTPDELRQLVNSAHAKGLAVILDVVYNHFGPEGNYLRQAGPYLSSKHTTVWGDAPNFDDPEHSRQLRRFFAANAIHWFEEYHIDGLRVDAIHCMLDDSEPHVAVEISRAVNDWSAESGRSAMLIAESNVYDPQMLASLSNGGVGFDAEWCDDFMHSVAAVIRPDRQACHRPYCEGTDLEQTLRFGYIYEGSLREERGRQTPTQRINTSGLIYSIQTHDFVGNHPLGERLHQLTSRETQRAAAALLILSPAIPMIFMGEEFACDQPFQFFVDFTDEHLRQAVVDGRKREYPQHDWSGGTLPIDPKAFYDSKIGASRDGDTVTLDWYQELIALRKKWRSTGLLHDAKLSVETNLDRGLFLLRYTSNEEIAMIAVRLVADPAGQDVCNLEPLASSDSSRLILDSRKDTTADGQMLPNHAKVFVASV